MPKSVFVNADAVGSFKHVNISTDPVDASVPYWLPAETAGNGTFETVIPNDPAVPGCLTVYMPDYDPPEE